MNEWMIYSVARNPHATWCCIGSSRDEVEARYLDSIAAGFDKPIYRVIASRKKSREAHQLR